MGAMHDLRMPKLGLTMTEGTLAEWKVEPGQPVRRGELLFVAETEKVANEIEASADGSIGEIRVLAGTTVPVGEVLATCSNAGGPASAAAEGARPAPTALNTSAPITRRDVVVGPRVVATPLARRLAKQSGIDLHTLRGGGPNGRIKAHDVLGARGERSGALQYAECVIPATSTRRAATRYETTVASRLATAKRDVPHFYAALEADIGPALALREQLNASPRRQRISVTHVLIAALARALLATPQANRVWCDGQIEEFQTVDIGLAVETERGLLAPLLGDVGRAPLDSIAAAARRLVARARNGGLTIKDVQGGAMTLSNVGMHRVKYLTPIINPGQAAILGVGSVQQIFRPGPGGEPIPRQEIGLALACDRRTWDGVAAAAFLNRVADNLAQPLELIRPIIRSE
jgi:pyruvate dehydrogenase E2 component (dihydrolipoamide acetyltransferase)